MTRGPSCRARGLLGRRRRWSSASRSCRRALLAQEAQNAGKAPKTEPTLPGSLDDDADARRLDPRRRRRQRHRLHRQGRARPGHQDRADPGRGRGAGRRAGRASTLVTADTARTPNEGYTAGSHSMQDSGTAILQRRRPGPRHPDRLGRRRGSASRPTDLRARDGAVLAAGRPAASATASWSPAARCTSQAQPDVAADADRPSTGSIGKPLPRVDIPAKVTGGAAYVQDLRLPGMVHARVVRPPSYGARLTDVDTAAVERLPGVLKVVRDGSFLAVIAEREWQAVKAMRGALAGRRAGTSSRACPRRRDLYAAPARRCRPQDTVDPRARHAAPRRRAHGRGELPPALPDARLDRPVLRRRRSCATAR